MPLRRGGVGTNNRRPAASNGVTLDGGHGALCFGRDDGEGPNVLDPVAEANAGSGYGPLLFWLFGLDGLLWARHGWHRVCALRSMKGYKRGLVLQVQGRRGCASCLGLVGSIARLLQDGVQVMARYRARTLVGMAATGWWAYVQGGLRSARRGLSRAGADDIDAAGGPVATNELAAAPPVSGGLGSGRVAEGGMGRRHWGIARGRRTESEVGEGCGRRMWADGVRRRREGDAEVLGGAPLVQRRPRGGRLARGRLGRASGKDEVGIRQELDGTRVLEGVEAGAKSGRLWPQHGVEHGGERGDGLRTMTQHEARGKAAERMDWGQWRWGRL